MKWLHCVRSVDPRGGGMIEMARQFGRSARRAGDEADLISLDRGDEPWVWSFSEPVESLGAGSSRYGFSARYLDWLRTHARAYDAIVAHGLWQYTGAGVAQVCRETGQPYTVFPHGMLDIHLRNLYPFKHLKKMIYWRWKEAAILRDAAAVCFLTEEEKRQARGTFHPYAVRETVVGAGIEDPPPVENGARVVAREFPFLDGRRYLLFLGRLHDKKGCDLLLRAYSKICRPGDHPSLVFAGPPDEGGVARLRRFIGKEVAARVHFVGMVGGERKWSLLAGAEALVIPSHQENFCLAVAEALACSVPVLISNKINIWPEVETHQAGFIDNDDLAGTQTVLLSWLGLPEPERKQMRLRARRCFEAGFRIDAVYERMKKELCFRLDA